MYKIIGRTCNCTGKPTNLILRTITEEEINGYAKEGMQVDKTQAVMVCPECNGITINWLFLNQNVETAKRALSNRYSFEKI